MRRRGAGGSTTLTARVREGWGAVITPAAAERLNGDAYLISGPWSLSGVKEAGIDYAIAKIPGFEGMNEAVPFAGVNVFYVAQNGSNRSIAESFIADVAKDSTVAEAMFAKNELPPAQEDPAEKLKSSRCC